MRGACFRQSHGCEMALCLRCCRGPTNGECSDATHCCVVPLHIHLCWFANSASQCHGLLCYIVQCCRVLHAAVLLTQVRTISITYIRDIVLYLQRLCESEPQRLWSLFCLHLVTQTQCSVYYARRLLQRTRHCADLVTYIVCIY
jgi:hypothetical protein